MMRAMIVNELIKIRHRLAFWVAFLSFTALVTIMSAEQYARELQIGAGRFTLPRAWENILTAPGPLGLLFGASVLILLVTGEFSWRTARQNVIDGMSKDQWFAAKLFLVPLIVILFVATQAGLGGMFAALVTDFGAADATVFTRHDLYALGGIALATLGIAATAFFFAFAVRSPGPAIALFFLAIVVLERLFFGSLLGRWEVTAPAAKYLPVQVFFTLLESTQYYPHAVARVIEAAEKAGRAAPVFPDTQAMCVAAAIYTVVFIGLAFVTYRRRDL